MLFVHLAFKTLVIFEVQRHRLFHWPVQFALAEISISRVDRLCCRLVLPGGQVSRIDIVPQFELRKPVEFEVDGLSLPNESHFPFSAIHDKLRWSNRFLNNLINTLIQSTIYY